MSSTIRRHSMSQIAPVSRAWGECAASAAPPPVWPVHGGHGCPQRDEAMHTTTRSRAASWLLPASAGRRCCSPRHGRQQQAWPCHPRSSQHLQPPPNHLRTPAQLQPSPPPPPPRWPWRLRVIGHSPCAPALPPRPRARPGAPPSRAVRAPAATHPPSARERRAPQRLSGAGAPARGAATMQPRRRSSMAMAGVLWPRRRRVSV